MTTFSFSKRTRFPAHTSNTGFRCPKCEVGGTIVKDSRQDENGQITRRRRCETCDYRFGTVEVLVDTALSQPERKRLKMVNALLPRLFKLADDIDLLKAEHD